jgi:hypothetical protein
MIYSAKGVEPGPQKTKEIDELPTPSCVKELQSFLGMVQYLSPFIPNVSDKTAPLHELLKNGNEYSWTSTHTKVFNEIKKVHQLH